MGCFIIQNNYVSQEMSISIHRTLWSSNNYLTSSEGMVYVIIIVLCWAASWWRTRRHQTLGNLNSGDHFRGASVSLNHYSKPEMIARFVWYFILRNGMEWKQSLNSPESVCLRNQFAIIRSSKDVTNFPWNTNAYSLCQVSSSVCQSRRLED